MRNGRRVFKRLALRIEQSPSCPLYVFSLTGEELLRVADISRVGRTEAGKLVGYQRAEVGRHIRNIVEYLDSDAPLIPNAVILALSPETRFRQARGARGRDRWGALGTIEIPLTENGHGRPAWIVDGQQRTLALARCRRKDFPVAVSAFVAEHAGLQREQFLRVNATKPLPRGLITELLPEVDSVLPANLAVRRVPSAVCDMLNYDTDSPFHGLIRRVSAGDTRKRHEVVSDTAVVQMIQESLSSPKGVLFTYRNVATGTIDLVGIRRVLLTYWNAVRAEFPEAWGLPPSRSRLMHSAGIRAMGRLMDRVMASVDVENGKAEKATRREIARLQAMCRWTSGAWEDLNRLKWNEIQNVPSHIRMLSDALVRAYLATKG